MIEFTDLPLEIQLRIFSFLDAKTLGIMPRVHRNFSQAARDDSLWREKLLRYFSLDIKTLCFFVFKCSIRNFFNDDIPADRHKLFYWMIEKDFSSALAQGVRFRDLTWSSPGGQPLLPLLARGHQDVLNIFYGIATTYRSNQNLVRFVERNVSSQRRLRYVNEYHANTAKYTHIKSSSGTFFSKFKKNRQIEHDESGKTKLHWAVICNQLDETARLIMEDSRLLNHPDWSEETPLHLAAHMGNTEMVELLLAQKTILIDLKNYLEETPLHLALNGKHILTAKALIAGDSNLITVDYCGFPPVTLAWLIGSMDLVRLILLKDETTASQREVARLFIAFLDEKKVSTLFYDLNTLPESEQQILASILEDLLVSSSPVQRRFPDLFLLLRDRYTHMLLSHPLVMKQNNFNLIFACLKHTGFKHNELTARLYAADKSYDKNQFKEVLLSLAAVSSDRVLFDILCKDFFLNATEPGILLLSLEMAHILSGLTNEADCVIDRIKDLIVEYVPKTMLTPTQLGRLQCIGKLPEMTLEQTNNYLSSGTNAQLRFFPPALPANAGLEKNTLREEIQERARFFRSAAY